MPDKKGIVAVNRLNVRSGPGTNFSTICQLTKGMQVDVQRQLDAWNELDLSKLEGYVKRAYVALTRAETGKENEPDYGIVEADALNVRHGPGYEFSTVSIVRREQMVEIIEEEDEWLHIKTHGLSGFIMSDLLVEIIGGSPITGGLYLAAVNDDVVNLRSGPALNYAVISVLPKNTEVNVKQVSNGWTQVQTIMREGYIRKNFVKPAKSYAIEPGDADTITTATVMTDQLRLRSGPDQDHPTIAYLSPGTMLNIKDLATDWLRVQANIKSAFILSRYIQEIDPTSPIEVASANDPLKPPLADIISIDSSFSQEQKIMARTWNQYGGLIQRISQEFSIDPVISLAVFSVESGGKGFSNDGRMIIRFENHYFYRYWGQQNEEQYKRHFIFDADKSWRGHQYRTSVSSPWQDVHTGNQKDEWAVLELASQLDRSAALKSISMGSPQIMGANHHLIGYSAVEDMFHSFQSDIRHQIWGFFRFVDAKKVVPDLRAQDFSAFARVYNGPGQASTYGNKIKLYYDEFKKKSHLV